MKQDIGCLRLLLLGPPGAGKGTQARMIADNYHLEAISTGDLLRAARKEGTALGQEAQKYMDRGELVPNEVVNGLVSEKLGQLGKEKGFMLDGYPRTVSQAEFLDGELRQLGLLLDTVIDLEVDDEEVIRRLTGRRTCSSCGQMYHVEYAPPVKPDICDRCGQGLVQRDDDCEATIRNRLEVYRRETAPLIEYYKRQGLLHEVYSAGSPEDMYQKVQSKLVDLTAQG